MTECCESLGGEALGGEALGGAAAGLGEGLPVGEPLIVLGHHPYLGSPGAA